MFAPPKVLMLAILVSSGTIAGCVDADSRREIVFVDIHGLAVDPSHPSLLYVATHHGLFRGENDGRWSKVSQDTMDFMGFTMHPTQPNVMYASGHPARPSAEYHHLGVLKSTDGGATWQTVALRNQVDFHAMTISLANPDVLWGWYYRDNQFYESTDAGATWAQWQPQGAPPRIYALAGAVADASTIYAAGDEGAHVSTDAGRSWKRLSDQTPAGPATVIATTHSDSARIWAFFPAVGFARSNDAGKTWTTTAPIDWGAQDAASAIAIDPTNPDVVYAASGRGAIHKTTDEGASWSLVRAAGATDVH
jgi:photosystem II stability/assembly factor-like uncharacterized protein